MQRVFEVFDRGVAEPAGEFVFVGIGDGMHDKIKAAPFGFQRRESLVHLLRVGDVDVDHRVRTHAFSQRLQPFAKGLALVGKRKLRALGGTGFGDAPCDGTFVGDAHDKPAFAFKKICHG